MGPVSPEETLPPLDSVKQGTLAHLESLSGPKGKFYSTQKFPPFQQPLRVTALRHAPKPGHQDLRA